MFEANNLKVYIEYKSDIPLNSDMMVAIEGFEMLGYIIKSFTKLDIATGKFSHLYKTYPFVGSTDAMKHLFKTLNCLPPNLDRLAYWPLRRFYNRHMNCSAHLSEVFYIWERQDELYGEPVFVKPIEPKLFDGGLIQKPNDLHRLKSFPEATKVIISEPILKSIKSEYRCFVFNNQLVDIRGYKGDFRYYPDKFHLAALYNMIDNFKEMISPIAYTFDIALLEDSELILIETSDFYSIGQYGLDPELYAKMLEARYLEILNSAE